MFTKRRSLEAQVETLQQVLAWEKVYSDGLYVRAQKAMSDRLAENVKVEGYISELEGKNKQLEQRPPWWLVWFLAGTLIFMSCIGVSL